MNDRDDDVIEYVSNFAAPGGVMLSQPDSAVEEDETQNEPNAPYKSDVIRHDQTTTNKKSWTFRSFLRSILKKKTSSEEEYRISKGISFIALIISIIAAVLTGVLSKEQLSQQTTGNQISQVQDHINQWTAYKAFWDYCNPSHVSSLPFFTRGNCFG